MPELPEVETVVRGLQPALTGQILERVELKRPDLRFPFPEGFAAALQGHQIERVARRAKYMLWHLETGDTALMHLGMSGRFTFASGPLTRHDHAVFVTQAGTKLRYNDPRRFGFMDLIRAGQASKFLDPLGPEPLSNAFDAAYLYDQVQGRTATIKACLLDQRLVAGVGNIYACEALFQAGLDPRRRAGSLTPRQAEALSVAIGQVLRRAIAAGGSSLRDFVQADGQLGYFQHAWAVYGRAGLPCPDCTTPIQRLVQSNRSSFFCEVCQT